MRQGFFRLVVLAHVQQERVEAAAAVDAHIETRSVGKLRAGAVGQDVGGERVVVRAEVGVEVHINAVVLDRGHDIIAARAGEDVDV